MERLVTKIQGALEYEMNNVTGHSLCAKSLVKTRVVGVKVLKDHSCFHYS